MLRGLNLSLAATKRSHSGGKRSLVAAGSLLAAWSALGVRGVVPLGTSTGERVATPFLADPQTRSSMAVPTVTTASVPCCPLVWLTFLLTDVANRLGFAPCFGVAAWYFEGPVQPSRFGGGVRLPALGLGGTFANKWLNIDLH